MIPTEQFELARAMFIQEHPSRDWYNQHTDVQMNWLRKAGAIIERMRERGYTVAKVED